MKSELPQYETGKVYQLSPEGLQGMVQNLKKAEYPGQHVLWTDDKEVELPIRMGTTGASAFAPTTLLEEWTSTLSKYASDPALSVKRDGKWVTISYQQYYDQNILFAKALLKLEIPEFASVVITGFNAPEWLISFHGSVFARCVPVGVYATNNKEVCEYITQHSGSKVVVAETMELAAKYTALLGKGEIERIVIYNDTVIGDTFGGKILHWKDFIQSGKEVPQQVLQPRQSRIKPGQCCTIMYTSGTTGMPKGVLISHDNCTWTPKAASSRQGNVSLERKILLSYLPLSHIMALYGDGLASVFQGIHLYFTDASALKGTLMDYVKEVRPAVFMSVSRLWEKVYQKLKEAQNNAGFIGKKIFSWAQGVGEQGTMHQARNQPTGWQFNLAKRLVYNKIKKVLGLQNCVSFGFGGAPLQPKVRKYFLSMNILLQNGYGMTETTAPQAFTDPIKFHLNNPEAYNTVGHTLPGGQTLIYKEKPEDAQGQICMRGRNVCMGYLKNAEAMSKTMDSKGYLHSGDIGRVNDQGELFITGRIKELIITSGGENIPPVMIQYAIKKALPCLSNAMLVGDRKNYLTCLISLVEDPPQSGQIEKEAAIFLQKKDCPVKTITEARNHPNFNKVIMQGLKEANTKAISRAQNVQYFYLLPEDFSPLNGTLTPTMKLKRAVVLTKYESEIEQMYKNAKL